MELWAAAELPATMVEEASCGGFGGGAGLDGGESSKGVREKRVVLAKCSLLSCLFPSYYITVQ